MAEAPDARPASPALLDDVVVMTRQAAVDGLPLTAVFDDLRLVLDLDPSDDLPTDVLRTCALAWAETHQGLSATRSSGVAITTPTDLENHLWALLADPDARIPSVALVVTVGRSDAVLRDADVLLVTASDLRTVFDRPGEHVALVRAAGSAHPDRVVVLTRAGDDRVALAQAELRELETRLHPLDDHPDGALAALRQVLDEH